MLLSACGAAVAPAVSRTSPTTTPTAPVTPSAEASPPPSDLILSDSRYGRILFDGSGRTLYLFSADSGPASRCYSACATAWPPFVVSHSPVAGQGLAVALVSTATRAGGALQVVYNGHPLYYYAGDHAPGEIKCQAVVEFGGGWYVVDGNGNKITRP
jgi:predicted lipoprotein with Yx(FWY)xxD motif